MKVVDEQTRRLKAQQRLEKLEADNFFDEYLYGKVDLDGDEDGVKADEWEQGSDDELEGDHDISDSQESQEDVNTTKQERLEKIIRKKKITRVLKARKKIKGEGFKLKLTSRPKLNLARLLITEQEDMKNRTAVSARRYID